MTVTRRELFLGLLVIALGVTVWVLLPSEEDRILERLEQAALALEREDAPGVMSVIDTGRFADAAGYYNAADIERGLGEAFKMFENIEVAMESPRISLEQDEKRATVTIRYVITGTWEGQFGFIVGSATETAMARFIMEKNPEAGWQVTELIAATLPGH